jgi:acyl transferase domain-containing protein
VPETDFVAHSAAVEPLEGVLGVELAGISPVVGRVPMVSTVTGEWVTGEELDASYWYANLRSMVRFEQATRVLLGDGFNAFVEVSTHPVLMGPVAETAEDAGVAGGVVTVGTLERANGGAARLVRSFAQAYVAGLAVDWKTILPTGERLDLPTYAFQHQPFWLQPKSTDLPVADGDGVASAAEARFWAVVEGGDLTGLADTLAIEDSEQLSTVLPALASWRRREQDRSATAQWRYRVTWAPVAEPSSTVPSGRWLLAVPAGLSDDEFTRSCAAALTDRGVDVVVMETEPSADRSRIADQLRDAADGSALTGVLSLLALDETPVPEHPAVPAGLAATLTLVQALGDSEIGVPLWAVTSGAVAVSPGEVLTSPAQAQTWGLGRVVGLETPELWGGLIDLPGTLDPKAGARLAAVLAGCGEDQTAVRTAGIFGARLTRAAQPNGEADAWSTDGTALVTGGTGALGGRLARWLTERGVPRLVLTSRSGPAAESVAATAAALAGSGARVDVMACDVSDRADLAGLLDWTNRSGPALSAVVHTAGVGQATLTAQTDVAETADVLAAKATGAALLDELTRDLDLDAFVLFSSISATWGSGLQPSYAAANTYLDALATRRRSEGLPATSIAWGPWGGGGMTDPAGATQMQRRGLMIMDPEHAVRAFGQILDGREGLVTVADVDWARFAQPFTLRRPSPLIADLPEVRRALSEGQGADDTPFDSDAGVELRRQLEGLPRAEQTRTLVTLVQTTAAAVLDYASPDDVDAARAFSDLGFDSLTSVELRNRLSAATGLRLPATLLFDCPTPTVLAEYLRGEVVKDGGTQLTLVQEVDRLGSLLTGADPSDENTYQLITDRLQGLLTQWDKAAGRTDREEATARISSASDDEIFDFIHRELGR